MKYNLSKIFTKLQAYVVTARYLPRVSVNSKLPFLIRVFAFLTVQKSIYHYNKKGIFISRNYKFQIRRRKILIEDKGNNIIIHIFFSKYNNYLYKKKRKAFYNYLKSSGFFAPKYSVDSTLSELLIVTEELIQGVSLDELNYNIKEKFIDLFYYYLNKTSYSQKINKYQQDLYFELKKTYERIKKILEPNSPFFLLDQFCGFPFEKDRGIWPVEVCHGQVLPINVIYDKHENKYYFIDYEPAGLGYGPFAYDYCFFLLYGYEKLSLKYIKKLKKIFFFDFKKHYIQKSFIAHIIWWSRNRDLNLKQIKKINQRSHFALSFFDIKKKNVK